jgi:hypothetical protein
MDPDPLGSALTLVGWIRIQVNKNDPQKKGEEIFCFEVIGCSLLRVEGHFMINKT